ncbi:MAG: phage tail tape measure protein, partial [Clostridium perfringens]|nr:phage tail tape measure protein [Clostridium perfringens]
SEGVNSANEFKKSLNGLQVNVGLTKEQMKEMEPIIKNIYNNNFGESFDDVASAVGSVNKYLNLTGDELQGATEKAFLMRDVFGYDINESVRSVDALMNNFGISSEEAFNLLSQGAQQGLDFSGELLDTVNEYSVQFKKAGLTAEDMFNILYDGSETGAWNLDKIGDAVKEFNIRLTDGSKGTSEALEKLGMDSEKVALTMSEGGEGAKKTYSEIIDKIASMSNKQEQNLVGTALFGTMWEDLGPNVISILGDIGDNFNATIDTADQMNEIKYDDLGSALETLKRNFETGIIMPIGEAILPLINEMVPKIQEVVNSIKSWIEENPKLATALFILMGVIGGILAILGPLIVFIGMLVISFGAISTAVTAAGGAMALFTGTILPIIGVIGAVIGVVVILAMSIKSNWEDIKSATNSLIETVKPYFEDFKASFQGL